MQYAQWGGVQPLISDISVSALSSGEFSYGDYLKYRKVDEDNDGTYDHIWITDCAGSATEIEIPGEIDGLKVTSIGGMACCTNLVSVNISDSVTSIDSYAFRDCTRLESINIPDSVVKVGDSAFDGTKLLESQTGVKYADTWVIDCDEDVTTVEIKDGTRGIADAAFDFCTSLANISIPDSVTSIGYNAFYGCTSLTNVNIPNSVVSIGYSAFGACTNLSDIEVAAENENYCSIDGVLFNKDKTELILYPRGNSRTEYNIPDSVTSIGNGTFSNCDSLANISIPDSVTSIGYVAFYGCTSLTNVNIPNSVVSIGDGAFSNCDSLTNVSIPNSVVSIGDGAFSNCDSLTNVNIPNSVVSIGHSVFGDCTNLTNIEVDTENKNYISIDGVLFNKDKTELIQYPIGNSRTEYDIPDSVIRIDDWAFSYCSSLTSINIPNSVSIICYSVFNCCANLNSITIKNPGCGITIDNSTISNTFDSEKHAYYFTGTIYGYENSTAQAYAEKYGYKFEIINDENVKGDLNGDGTVSSADAVLMNEFLTNSETSQDILTAVADMNGDGVINVFDLIILKRSLLS